MRYLVVMVGVLLQSAAWANSQAPSLELLLYLAEWGQDASGELVDPLDLESSDAPTYLAPMDTQPQADKPTAEEQQ